MRTWPLALLALEGLIVAAVACGHDDATTTSANGDDASTMGEPTTFTVPASGGSIDVAEPSGTTLTFTFDAALAGLSLTFTPVDASRVAWSPGTKVREGVLLAPAGLVLTGAAHVRSSRRSDLLLYSVHEDGAARTPRRLIADPAGFPLTSLDALAIGAPEIACGAFTPSGSTECTDFGSGSYPTALSATCNDGLGCGDFTLSCCAPPGATTCEVGDEVGRISERATCDARSDGSEPFPPVDAGALCPGAVDMTPDGGVVPPVDPATFGGWPATATECGTTPSLVSYTFLAPTQVTWWSGHTFAGGTGGFGLDVPCGQGPLTCDGYQAVYSKLLLPGRHYFASQGHLSGPGAFLFEVPPPPPTNTTLATATPLVSGVRQSFDRIVDTQPRVYSFVHNWATNVFLTPTNCWGAWAAQAVDCDTGDAGAFQGTNSLYGTCYNGGTGATYAAADAAAIANIPTVTPPGRYCIVITAQPGVKLDLEYEGN